jgi:BirA family transcriptional regulator, biotin operon repressor / biotin---[acetyl-CoA-carboxylase] ligase
MTALRASFRFRWRVERVESTGSTNADLVDAARAGAPDGLVLVTDHQTAGRGRLGRSWQAPPGASILVSVLLRPPLGAALHGATQALGLAARAACTDIAGVTPDVKWPNDLLVGDRKLAGVLAESVVEGGVVTALVIGMGLNVNWPAEVPGDLAGIMTSLNHVVGHEVDREDLLGSFLTHLDHRVTQWTERPADLFADYRAVLATLGRTIMVARPGEPPREGVATDVTADGVLLVDVEGEVIELVAGDVTHTA